MSGPVCKQCGSTAVAWRAGKNGGRYLIDTKRPHFCPKPTARKPRAAPTPVPTYSKDVTAAEAEHLEALVRDALKGKGTG